MPHPPCGAGHTPLHLALPKALAPHGGNFHLSNYLPMSSASLSLVPFLSFPSLRYHFFQQKVHQSCFHPLTPLLAGCSTPLSLPILEHLLQHRTVTFGSFQWEYCSIIFPKRSQTFLVCQAPFQHHIHVSIL